MIEKRVINYRLKNNDIVIDMENTEEDIDLIFTKVFGRLTKRVYYQITFKDDINRATIILNEEQLKKLKVFMQSYMEKGKYKKSSKAKGSKYEVVI